MYHLTKNEARLPEAITRLLHRPNVKGKCLGYVREALTGIDLSLPPASLLIEQTGHSTALACYHALAKDPAKYGWVPVHDMAAHPCLLVFFGACGYETAANGERIVAGHIALKQGNTIYASNDYAYSPYFQSRLLGAFIPA